MTRVKQGYLRLYNVVSLFLWVSCLADSLKFGVRNPKFVQHYKPPLVLMLVQTLNMLDILHAGIGLIKSTFSVTLLQITSRLLVTWVSLFFFYLDNKYHRLKPSYGPFMCVVAWSLAEIIRFMFYIYWYSENKAIKKKQPVSPKNSPNIFATKKQSPLKHTPNHTKSVTILTSGIFGRIYLAISEQNLANLLMKLRYSMFFVLYPLGICGEILALYAVHELWAIPSRLMIGLLLAVYPIGTYKLMTSAYSKFKTNIYCKWKKKEKAKKLLM